MSILPSREVRYILGVASIVVACAASSKSDEVAPRFVVEDYLKSLATLEEKFANCSGECLGTTTQERTEVAGNTETFVNSRGYSFAYSRGAGRLVETTLHRDDRSKAKPDPPKKKSTPTPYETVTGYNPDYSFSLSKSSPGAAFVVSMLEKGPDRGKRLLYRGVRNPSHFFTHVLVTPIDAIVRAATFRVEKVRELEPVGGSRRLRVDFTKPPEATLKAGSFTYTSGWFVFSPEHGWIMHEYGVIPSRGVPSPKPITQFGRYEYTRNSDGELRPLKYRLETYPKIFEDDPSRTGAKPTSLQEFVFTSFRFGETPAKEFTLAAFGLPEFAEPAARRLNRPFPWWIVGVAVGVAGLAAVSYRLARRPRESKPEPSA